MQSFRFLFTKSYSLSGDITKESITQFIELASENKLKPFFESEEPLPEEYSEKVVGEDFKKKIIQSSHD